MNLMGTDATTVIITTYDNRVLLQKRENLPSIECPGALALISGYINPEETPLDAAIREVTEELSTKKSLPVKLGKMTYLGTIWRYDYNRYDYIHHAYLISDAEDVLIHEGLGVSFYNLNDDLELDSLAAHHRYYLQRYKNKIMRLDFDELTKNNYQDITLGDLFEVQQLPEGKDLLKLKNGGGFYEGENDTFSSLLDITEDIKFMGYLKFMPNKPRGNHYHFRKVEYMLLLSGEMNFELRLAKDGNTKTNIKCTAGQIVKTLPGVIHTLTAVSNNPVAAIELSPQQFDNNDVIKLGK